MSDNEQRDHRELSKGAIKARINEMEIGDKILFDDRKTPLEVIEVNEYTVRVEGPRGGEYSLGKRDGKLGRKVLADDTPGVIRNQLQSLTYVEIKEKSPSSDS